MKRLLLLLLLTLFVGCGADKKEVPPITDPEKIKAEQEKMEQMHKDTGEKRS